jgi:hypothetical protein
VKSELFPSETGGESGLIELQDIANFVKMIIFSGQG